MALRLRVEASRASSRTALRTIAGFSVTFLAILALFARSYMAPYGSATGQLVMALVGLLFGSGLALMARMAKPRVSGRILASGSSPP